LDFEILTSTFHLYAPFSMVRFRLDRVYTKYVVYYECCNMTKIILEKSDSVKRGGLSYLWLTFGTYRDALKDGNLFIAEIDRIKNRTISKFNYTGWELLGSLSESEAAISAEHRRRGRNGASRLNDC
jgi:hypothetical protein